MVRGRASRFPQCSALGKRHGKGQGVFGEGQLPAGIFAPGPGIDNLYTMMRIHILDAID